MSNTSSPPPSPLPGAPSGFRPIKAALVLLASLALAASSVLTMFGPQIMAVVLLALIAGLFFAVKRSAWAFVCFGYPLTFALFSAWFGFMEISRYENTTAFAASVGIGLLGLGLIATGLWRVNPRNTRNR